MITHIVHHFNRFEQSPSWSANASISYYQTTKTVMTVFRPMDDPTWPISITNTTNMIWAFGLNNSFVKHRRDGTGLINFLAPGTT